MLTNFNEKEWFLFENNKFLSPQDTYLTTRKTQVYFKIWFL